MRRATTLAASLAFLGACSDSSQPQPTPVGMEGIVFSSDWSTALGGSDHAVRDGGRWTGFRGSFPEFLEVVEAEGFPSAHVLRAKADRQATRMVVAYDRWRAPEIGESLYMRVYFRYNYHGEAGTIVAQHWWQPHSGLGAHSHNFRFTSPHQGVVRLQFNLRNQARPTGGGWLFNSPPLAVGTVYRLEARFERIDALSFAPTLRVYQGDALLYENGDFQDAHLPGVTLATSGVYVLPTHIRQMTTWEIGNNGPAAATATTQNLWEVGSAAVGLEDWIGAG